MQAGSLDDRRGRPGRGERPGRWLVVALAAAVVAVALAGAQPRSVPTAAPAASDGGLRVVSFNIRYGSANDGPDRWELRRDRAVATVRDLAPGVLGLQEAEAFQVAELLDALPGHAALGVGRDDGRTRGESSPILFDRLRFTVAESGVMWLGETPEVIGSRSADAAITRVCTWARLIELRTGRGLYVYNAHFDHRGQRSRELAAEQLADHARRMSERADRRDPVIVMGDFNAAEDNPAFQTLTKPDERGGLIDTFRAVHPDAPGGTFTGFDTASDGGTAKIDHVLIGPGLQTLDAGIDRRTIDGRYPSDHFPVWADVAWARVTGSGAAEDAAVDAPGGQTP